MTTGTADTEPCIALPWDSQFWGFPIARLAAPTLTPRSVEAAVAWCTRHGVRCLYFLAAASCRDTLALAHAHGFRFVDVRVELSLALRQPPPAGTTRVRPAVADDLPALRRLAAESHHDSRFFKDDRFATARAADLFAAWIDRDFSRHSILVCESPAQPGVPCGYVSCECDADRHVGRIGLIAVAARHTHAGYGSALVAAALQLFDAARLSTVHVVTQGTNVAALRLYERNGFLTTSVNVWYHKWFGQPPE